MIVHREFIQGSLEWQCARAGRVCASEIGNLVTDKFELRKGETPRTYLASKIAEKWIGGPLPGFGSFATEQGSILETEAIPWLELEIDKIIDRPGFITTDCGLAGCSPDGLIGEEGVEIKCYQPTKAVKTLLDGMVPEDHLPQIHFSMFVTGFKSWKYLSYSRLFPKLVLTVHRDEAIIRKLENALERFYEVFDDAWAAMVKLNGGEPVKRTVTDYAPTPTPEDQPDATGENFDLIP